MSSTKRGKIISLFNHKGGVGKTTFAYNLGYALAYKGKKVLLIDADSQLNLTLSVYGFIDEVLDEKKNQNTNTGNVIDLESYLRDYLSIKDLIESGIANQNIEKKVYINRHCSDLHLVSGSLESYKLDLQLSTLVKTGGDAMRLIFSNVQRAVQKYKDEYDLIIIDTSPSASSVLNATLVAVSDYFIAPATPSFFSKEAIRNLTAIFRTWKTEVLTSVLKLPNSPNGLDFNAKFLGLCVQMARRFDGKNNKDGISHAHSQWSDSINDIIKPFFDIHNYVNSHQFNSIFPQSKPYVINKCIDVAPELRSIAERSGKPVIAITQDDCDCFGNKGKTNITNEYFTHRAKKTKNNHYSAKKLITEQIYYIADNIIDAVQKNKL